MCNRGVDLARIPQSGPFMNYRNWLDWKLRSLQCEETVQLPIFSAIIIERYQDGFALIFGSQHARGFSTAEGVINFIETHTYQPNEKEERLARIATIKVLRNQGADYLTIAKELNLAKSTISYHLSRLTATAA